jgi:hypothetical protein
MLGGIGHGEARHLGKRLHATFALGKKLQEFQSVSAAQCLANTGKLGEEILFEMRAC